MPTSHTDFIVAVSCLRRPVQQWAYGWPGSQSCRAPGTCHAPPLHSSFSAAGLHVRSDASVCMLSFGYNHHAARFVQLGYYSCMGVSAISRVTAAIAALPRVVFVLHENILSVAAYLEVRSSQRRLTILTQPKLRRPEPRLRQRG